MYFTNLLFVTSYTECHSLLYGQATRQRQKASLYDSHDLFKNHSRCNLSQAAERQRILATIQCMLLLGQQPVMKHTANDGFASSS